MTNIDEALKRLMAEPSLRGALALFAADKNRNVLDVCPDCSFEIADNDRHEHRCPPDPNGGDNQQGLSE